MHVRQYLFDFSKMKFYLASSTYLADNLITNRQLFSEKKLKKAIFLFDFNKSKKDIGGFLKRTFFKEQTDIELRIGFSFKFYDANVMHWN